MSHRAEIGQRIKKLRNKNNFSQTHVANILFISQAAYSLIENSQNGIVVDHILKLSQLYDISTDFILKGENNYIKVERANGFVPLIRAHRQSEFIRDLSDDSFSDLEDWFRVPGFMPVEDHRLFEVSTNNLTPTILTGDILVCQNHQKFDEILDGTAVIVVTGDQIYMKRFKKSSEEGYLLLENDNEYTSETGSRIKIEEVRELMIIRGKISSGLVQYHEISGKGKINALEQDLELLKKELFSMNKKLTILSSKND
ncbi:helix-turn-helix domain-containing protein [Gramella sp. MT6]|uniref:XRE family transcriptional regulator n=1 Tax=Gramella sp. MT6 TaxID=2705471 RepID=UPI001C5E7157|nr:XRE family transcriptional regulator [Gramella sp. MT6]QYA25672.1 helix-turn-helix domain-containing protein [Gramella sp. MT6]